MHGITLEKPKTKETFDFQIQESIDMHEDKDIDVNMDILGIKTYADKESSQCI